MTWCSNPECRHGPGTHSRTSECAWDDAKVSHLSPNGGERHAGTTNDCGVCSNSIYIKLQTTPVAESKRVKLYIDPADWWVGLYIGPNHVYLCILPCVVLRIKRRRGRSEWASGGMFELPQASWADAGETVTHAAVYDSSGPECVTTLRPIPDSSIGSLQTWCLSHNQAWHVCASRTALFHFGNPEFGGKLGNCTRQDDHPITECMKGGETNG